MVTTVKTVDAFWDTRSLGVRTAEISFEMDDGLESLNEALSFANDYQYVVAKVASGNTEMLTALQQVGFSFIECSIEVTIDLRTLELPRMAKRFDQHITVEQATDVSKERIFTRIRNGLFDTDRIALDPAFSADIAARRYVNWISDELERGGELYHVFYKGDEAGFFSYKETDPGVEAFPFLAGLYEEFKTSGIGLNIAVATPAQFAKERGCRRIRTYVSSNNVPILRIHEMLGYTVSNIRYVLVKHQ